MKDFMPKRSTRSRRNSKFSPVKNSNSDNQSSESIYDSDISNSSSDESIDELKELKNDLNSQLKELVFYKIEMPSSSSNKKIITCIEKILDIFNSIFKDKLEDNEFDNINQITANKEENLKVTSHTLAELEKKDSSDKKNKIKNKKPIDLNNFSTFEVYLFTFIQIIF